MSDFIPAEDHLALAWMNQFSAAVSGSPYTYLLAPADATTIAATIASFASALAITDNDVTRTKITIATKDDARATAEQMCRRYAGVIKMSPGISDPEKLAAGVRPINSSRETIEVPNTSPVVNIVAATPGAQTLRFADSLTPEDAAKPFGAMEH